LRFDDVEGTERTLLAAGEQPKVERDTSNTIVSSGYPSARTPFEYVRACLDTRDTT
jgi:hypothetical protein